MVHFLGDLKTPKFPSEINWTLLCVKILSSKPPQYSKFATFKRISFHFLNLLQFIHLFQHTLIHRVMRFQLTQFSIARYSESLSSDSTNTNFEINLPLACKNPLLTDNLIVQPYCTALLYNLTVQPYCTALFTALGPLHVLWQVSFGCWVTWSISSWQEYYKSVFFPKLSDR